MDTPHASRRLLSRRALLRLGGVGALALASGGAWARPQGRAAVAAPTAAPGPPVYLRLAATDGEILVPGRAQPIYMFGFVSVPLNVPPTALDTYKGNVQVPAPIIAVDQDRDLYLTLTNIGLAVRPDLADSHTVHWHGFRNALSIFDGVPEASIAVPVGRDFSFFYRPHDPGTYMYHCHFEDVEHVQMGMTGIVYVRPIQNGSAFEYPSGSGRIYTRFAYNDGDGSTGYTREFTLLLNEIWSEAHDNLASIQESIWPNYKPDYFVINGRAYPDTLKLNNDPSLPSQPISSLIQVNGGDQVLLRVANLGFEQHALQLPGARMRVVGEDATLLRGRSGADLSYSASSLYLGPGEARDAIFTAPAFVSSPSVGDPQLGPFNRYLLRSRSFNEQSNGKTAALGGMITELRVYRDALPAQTEPNQTYP